MVRVVMATDGVSGDFSIYLDINDDLKKVSGFNFATSFKSQ